MKTGFKPVHHFIEHGDESLELAIVGGRDDALIEPARGHAFGRLGEGAHGSHCAPGEKPGSATDQ
jgi:hypothetical protein